MTEKKKMPQRGHPENQFHKVDHPGTSMSLYLEGKEIVTLMLALREAGQDTGEANVKSLARIWFHEMMEQKKNEFSRLAQNS